MTAKTIPSYVEVYDQKSGYVGYSRGNKLDEVYGSYSAAKAWAWEHCESLCAELDGYNLCITSANTYIFTAQFEFDSPENGRPMVCHITPSRTYAMYLDVHRIEVAKKIWREYAECYDGMPHSRAGWRAENGKGTVLWVDSFAYVIVGNEAYRVDNAFTRRGLRMCPTLIRVGSMCDDAVDALLWHRQVFCRASVPCHVKFSADYGEIYAGYVDSGVNGEGNDAWDVGVPIIAGEVMTRAAVCVDACAMLHGFDAQGATVKLMD